MLNLIFFLIVAFVTIDFVFGSILSWLNRRAASSVLPPQVAAIYNQQEYAQQQAYFKSTNAFSSIVRAFEYVLMMAMLFAGGFGYLDHLAYQWMPSPVLAALFFFAVIYIGNDLLTLPFSYYRIFFIEQRFGFNRMTRRLFFADFFKQVGLSCLIGGGLIAGVYLLYQQWGNLFWLYAWGLICAILLFVSFFYSSLIVPLFNKQTPLEQGSLRDAIEQFSQQVDFPLRDIYVMDGSKRSTKANAYFSGFGRTRRIVLYDTLIKELDQKEIIAVIAHEIGHYQHQHTIRRLMSSVGNVFVLLYVFSFLVESQLVALAMGATFPTFELGLIAFTLLYSPVGLLTGIWVNYISRCYEYQADDYAAQCGYAVQLISALKKLSVHSLANLTPAPIYVFIYYSHPTLLQRANRLQQYL